MKLVIDLKGVAECWPMVDVGRNPAPYRAAASAIAKVEWH